MITAVQLLCLFGLFAANFVFVAALAGLLPLMFAPLPLFYSYYQTYYIYRDGPTYENFRHPLVSFFLANWQEAKRRKKNKKKTRNVQPKQNKTPPQKTTIKKFIVGERVKLCVSGKWLFGTFEQYGENSKRGYGVHCDQDQPGMIRWTHQNKCIVRNCPFTKGERVKATHLGKHYDGTFKIFRRDNVKAFGVHCDSDKKTRITWCTFKDIQHAVPPHQQAASNNRTIANVFQSQALPNAVAIEIGG